MTDSPSQGRSITGLILSGGGARAAALGLALSIAQGAVDALAAGGWRMLLLPLAVAAIPVVNLSGWLLAWLLPARGLLPGAYFVRTIPR